MLLILGLTFDCYDGKRGGEGEGTVLSKDQQKCALPQPPNLMEMLSHSFFIGSYFAGPLIAFKKFKEFTQPDYQSKLPGSPIRYGMKRLGLGFLYMLIHLIGSSFVPWDWPLSEAYHQTSFLSKMMIFPLWCRFILYKYMFFWLIAEGVCIISGLSFNGVREDGRIDWKGCANVKIVRLETATTFGHIIEAWNTNTNAWAAAYIYKRLKFMNNRMFSQACTLVFLSVWHGFHSGYYVTFLNEFVVINVEKEFTGLLARSERMERVRQHPAGPAVCQLLGWLWVFFFMSQCFIPFSLFSWDKYLPTYRGMYFILWAVYLSWPAWRPLTKSFLKLKPKAEKKE